MARNDTDWSKPQPSARQEREAQQMAEEIAASYGDDYGAGFFDYGPMTAPQPASPYQGVIDAADTALANLAAINAASEQRQRRFADQAAIQDALALQRQQAERMAAEQYQRRIADQAAVRYGSALERGRLNNQIRSDMARAYSGVTNFGMGPMVPLGSDIYPDTFSSFTPGQQASLNQYLQRGPGRDYSFGIVPGIMGALGMPSKYDQITSGDYRPVFVGDELYGAFGAGPFGGNVYTGRTLPYETAQEYGIPGYFPPEEGDSAPEVTAPIQDPATGQQRCPDGYIFDEDLNACRLAPMDVTATTATPGEAYARTGLLDVAPEGLLDFRQRYGAGFGTPMDFEAANLAFRRQGATYPEYFRTAPKLDGYTLLS
jgi:hypothetical protein